MQQAPTTPNLFDLTAGDVAVHYAASSLDGTPRLTYRAPDATCSFRGDEIRVSEGELGVTVTVTLETMPDRHVKTLTLLVPGVNLEGDETRIETLAIVTTHRTSIGGPALVRGQLQIHEAIALQGTAQQVHF